MNTLERLKAYLDSKGILVGTAEKACGFGNALLRNAFKGGKGIGSDNVEIFLRVYSDLSAEWLFRGVGSMLLDDKEQAGGHNNKYYAMCQMILQNKQAENELYGKLADLMSKGE